MDAATSSSEAGCFWMTSTPPLQARLTHQIHALPQNHSLSRNTYSKDDPLLRPKSPGYRKTNPLLASSPLSEEWIHVNNNSFVYVVKIFHLSNLRSDHSYFYGSNPYVEMKYISSSQSTETAAPQRTSYKPLTTHPEWVPPERFEFCSLQEIKSKELNTSYDSIQFTVYSLMGGAISTSNLNLGTITLSLEGISENETPYTLPLYHPDDESLTSAEIKLSIQKMSSQMASLYQQILVYEYERWQFVLGWGNSYPGHLLPLDPGRWSNVFGSQFEMDLTKIVAPLPDGWSSINEFEVQATSRDPRGWEYAFDFSSTDWYPQSFANAFVRRRIWKKEICNTQLFLPANRSALSTYKRAAPSPIITRQRTSSLTSSSSLETPKFIPTTFPSPRFSAKPSPSSSPCTSSCSSPLTTGSSALAVQLLSFKMLTTKFYYFYFDSSEVKSKDTFAIGITIPLSFLPLHSQYTQIIDCLGLRLLPEPQTFPRNLTQFILQTKDGEREVLPTEQLANDAFTLHFAGNLLMGLELCLLKEETECLSNLVRVILSSTALPRRATSSKSLSSSSSLSSETDPEAVTEAMEREMDAMERFRPSPKDVIPIFLISCEQLATAHHIRLHNSSEKDSSESMFPPDETRLRQICERHVIGFREWDETVDGIGIGIGIGVTKKTMTTAEEEAKSEHKKLWKIFVFNKEKEDRPVSHGSLSSDLDDQSSDPQTAVVSLTSDELWKYDSLMCCVRDIILL